VPFLPADTGSWIPNIYRHDSVTRAYFFFFGSLGATNPYWVFKDCSGFDGPVREWIRIGITPVFDPKTTRNHRCDSV